MNLLPDEWILSIFDDNSFTLTTHRISQEHKSFADSQSKTIKLENITSFRVYRKRSWLLLMLGFIALVIVGVTYKNGDYNITGSAAGLAFLIYVFFFMLQLSAIKISSPSTLIHVNILDMSQRKVDEFLYMVEKAKEERLRYLMQKIS